MRDFIIEDSDRLRDFIMEDSRRLRDFIIEDSDRLRDFIMEDSRRLRDFINFIKNVTTKLLKLWDFSFFLSNTFIYEPILIKNAMNAYIMKKQIFYNMMYDLKGH